MATLIQNRLDELQLDDYDYWMVTKVNNLQINHYCY